MVREQGQPQHDEGCGGEGESWVGCPAALLP